MAVRNRGPFAWTLGAIVCSRRALTIATRSALTTVLGSVGAVRLSAKQTKSENSCPPHVTHTVG
eukprot:2868856-Alexandrium_andersonii.AAC.1